MNKKEFLCLGIMYSQISMGPTTLANDLSSQVRLTDTYFPYVSPTLLCIRRPSPLSGPFPYPFAGNRPVVPWEE